MSDLDKRVERWNKADVDISGANKLINDLIEKLRAYTITPPLEYWQNLYPDGMTEEDVQNELRDFHTVLDGLGELYCHITGGRLSKANTDKAYIRQYFDEYVATREKEAVINALKNIGKNLGKNHCAEAPVNSIHNLTVAECQLVVDEAIREAGE